MYWSATILFQSNEPEGLASTMAYVGVAMPGQDITRVGYKGAQSMTPEGEGGATDRS